MYEAAYGYKLGSLPGTVKGGGWVHFGDFEGVRSGNIIDGNYGFYGIVDQLIYRLPGDEDKGVGFFGRLIGSPSDRNTVDFYAEAGLTFSGLIAARPDDVLGVAFAYTNISSDASGADIDAGLDVIRDYEALIEVSYTAQLAAGWTLQPDFQYIWNPGGRVPDASGTAAVGNAAVFGVRTSLNY